LERRPPLGKDGQALTAQFYKTAEEKYEEQLRTLGHIISACTLGLLSFAAGLLIGVFILFH
jgi:hypothetical protein